ncbi:hypothetical protein DVR12_13485 [Chitinophaga silvatica]|uniref:Uncharacterized protein n=1 Tax=Chitinophaga silvatica TaxID=2282649 RepID=A0A3E1YAX9_9BACT|nr:hypothetical protein [Chitinophaga silvatica]RFS22796.1 hypothetical protein DVR12_13485 [Chitinophaga silvatica]
MTIKKILLLSIVLLSIGISVFAFRKYKTPAEMKCAKAVTYSEMAYVQFKKAYRANSEEVAQRLIKKGLDQIKEASVYAVQCECTTSETYALTAYTIARKASEAATMDELKPQIKKAMDLSMDAMHAAQKCNK